MKKLILFLFLLLIIVSASYPQRIAPAATQDSAVMLIGTIHVGNGQVIANGAVIFDQGKITYAGEAANAPKVNGKMKVINAAGAQIYPGIIAPNTYLGLAEIDLVRATNDYGETGIFNPGVRSLIAYNTDSKIIPTVRSNGVLLVQAVPQGGTVSGASSIMQLDAWNWQDAVYKEDDGIHLNWPSFFNFQFNDGAATVSVNEDYEKQVNEIRSYFIQARAYNENAMHAERNINFEAVKNILAGNKKIFIHCEYVKEIMNAVSFAKDFRLKMVVVGGRDTYMCTDILKENNVPVILGDVHALPQGEDVEVHIPYSKAALLQKAGVLYCLSVSGSWQQRNLPFMCGTTVAYGITKEDALKSITSNTAKILGIDDVTGTVEAGKDANLVISSGDLLDMKTNAVQFAFIQGRQINLDNSQKQLYATYMKKFGLK
ncbi:MAG: amidohydrolase family protein [Chitinophagales bacterium]|nr:amidohydrolase family protein [Chitinophagales bacterium]